MEVHGIKRVKVVLAGILMATLIACGGRISGTYVHDKDSKEYLELRPDSTFFLRERGMGLSGKYRIDGATVTLTVDGGMSTQGNIRGKTLIDDDGEKWVRR
jgi:hypothetical protein